MYVSYPRKQIVCLMHGVAHMHHHLNYQNVCFFIIKYEKYHFYMKEQIVRNIKKNTYLCKYYKLLTFSIKQNTNFPNQIHTRLPHFNYSLRSVRAQTAHENHSNLITDDSKIRNKQKPIGYR